MQSPQPGTRINDFTVAYRISRGMNADVFAVWHHKLLVPLVCKRLRPEDADNSKWRNLLHQEGEALSKMCHPGIVRLIESNDRTELPYLLLEHVGGQTLRDALRKNRSLGADWAVRITQHVAAAVAHVHSKGYLHRDLKPSNLILRDTRPILLDFGVVWRIEPEREPPDRSGTPQYLSPEQISRKKLSPATDVYGLGMLLFELLTGERAFNLGAHSIEDDELSLRYPQLVEDPKQFEQIGCQISRELAAVVYRCLNRSPAKRFQSAVDLIKALDRFTNVKIWTEAIGANDPFS